MREIEGLTQNQVEMVKHHKQMKFTRTMSLEPVLAASMSGVAPLSADFSLTYSLMLTFIEATRLRRSRTPYQRERKIQK